MRKKTKDSLGLFQVLLFTTMFYVLSCVDSSPLGTQSVSAQTAGLPFRPIGSESAVDRYSAPGQYTQTGYRENVSPANNRSSTYGNVRQVAMQSGGFALPPGDMAPPNMTTPMPNQFTAPPLNTPPQLQPRAPQGFDPLGTSPMTTTPNLQPAPSTMPPLTTPPSMSNAPRTLPNNLPANVPSYQNAPNLNPVPVSPMADYQPMAPPQLSNGGFSTMSDCRLITPASPYAARSPYGDACGCGVEPMSYAGPYTPPPAEIATPAVMPPYQAVPVAGGMVAPATAAPAGSLVTFGQETYPIQVGQGLWGQPVAYVPGQRVRNWLRYLSF